MQITSLLLSNQDALITWETVGGTTNTVQATTNLMAGFDDVSPPLIINGQGMVRTNFLDSGARTTASPRFYRIKIW